VTAAPLVNTAKMVADVDCRVRRFTRSHFTCQMF
jgi:hypothetical protein